jgi:hypothetical protein
MTDTEFGPEQSRTARALLGWSPAMLASSARVGVSTVADFERGYPGPQAAAIEAMRATLEGAGILFAPGGVSHRSIGDKPPASPAQKGKGRARLLTATDVKQWAERFDARTKLPELIAKLIRADLGSAPQLRFPSDEGIEQPGWDGTCATTTASGYVPQGSSGWELTTQKEKITQKANKDYTNRTISPEELEPSASTFIFVTLHPLPAKKAWVKQRKAEGKWADVRAYDATDLLHWIEGHPGVEHWLARRLGKMAPGIRLLEEIWGEWSGATEWKMTPEIVLADRDEEAARLHQWMPQARTVLSVQAESTDEAIAFLMASFLRLPQNYRAACETRCLVATTDDAARELAQSTEPLIIVIADPTPGLAQHVIGNGHQVYAAYSSDLGLPKDAIRLSRPQTESLALALINSVMGPGSGTQRTEHLDEKRLELVRLAEDCGGSLITLRRLLYSGDVPTWATDLSSRALPAALLAGEWDESSQGDRQTLERLFGGTYATLTAELTRVLNRPESPIRKVRTVWKLASPRDAWHFLAPSLTSHELDTYQTCVLDVLQAPDPRFALDGQGRQMAAINGVQLAHSGGLREGLIRTLLLLSLFADRASADSGAEHRPHRIIRTLLSDADAQRWWSLASEMQYLAEISPDQFLEALEDSLNKTEPPVAALLADDAGDFGRTYIANLLWGLEALAWDPQYFDPVAQVLAQLTAQDNGPHRYQNRPKNTLRNLFFVSLPQTNATLEQRLLALDRIRRRFPVVAWQLMLSINPRGGYLSRSATPRWRPFSAQRREQVTGPLIARSIEELVTRLIEDAGPRADRWADIVRLLPGFALPALRSKVIGALSKVTDQITNPEGRTQLRTLVYETALRHREFSYADWAMPEEDLRPLDRVLELLAPADSVTQAVWLFNRPHPVGFIGYDHPQGKTELNGQGVALGSVIADQGLDGVFDVAKEAKQPRMVGVALGFLPDDNHRTLDVLKRGLSDNAPVHCRELALGLARQHVLREFGLDWGQQTVSLALIEAWGTSAVASLLEEFPMTQTTWDYVQSLGPEIEEAYWKAVNHHGIPRVVQAIKYGAEQLLSVGRTREAVEICGQWARRRIESLNRRRELPQPESDISATKGSASHPNDREDVLPSELLVRSLQQLIATPPPASLGANASTMLPYYVVGILQRLDEATDCDGNTIAAIEWALLPILEDSDRHPKALHTYLATNPAFFVEVLSQLYESEERFGAAETDTDSLSEREQAQAQRAYQLLSAWRHVPGTQGDGSIDAKILLEWVKEARAASNRAERLKSADIHIGEMLAHGPKNGGAAWPIEAICNVIDETQSRDIDSSFVTETYNQRGVVGRHPTEGGEKERELAQRYRTWSKDILAKFPRTARLLEKIAKFYEADAKRQDEDVELRT